MSPPIRYIPNFIKDPDRVFRVLRDELPWIRRDKTPRHEVYCHDDLEAGYVYGKREGERLYMPGPYHPLLMDIRLQTEAELGTILEACFLNWYKDKRDHLGYHADNSPLIDPKRPIAVLTFLEDGEKGVARELWMRKIDPRSSGSLPDAKQKLGHGSLLVMGAGMQQTWEHRIPKSDVECGARISATFRGWLGKA